LGFPIRKSPDQSSLANSPRLIAGCYVLLRLLVPRHPPCALNNLDHKDLMLASTVQFSSDGRCQFGLIAYQIHLAVRCELVPTCPEGLSPRCGPLPDPSGPNSVPKHRPLPTFRSTPRGTVLGRPEGPVPTSRCSTHELNPRETYVHDGALRNSEELRDAP
jgi:hypothetical protein